MDSAVDANARPPAIGLRGVERDVPLSGLEGGCVRILDGVDLSVPVGALVHIVGPSGAGKSSLIRLVNRLDEPTGGVVEVLSRNVTDWPPRELRRRVAMVFQEPTLLGFTARQNLALADEFAPDDGAASRPQRMATAMRIAGLDESLADRTADQLSVGQKKRVALARALMTRPEVLLLDEPTAGLDLRAADALLDSLARLRDEQGTTVVMVTHRLHEAKRLGGSLVVLLDGRVAAHGNAAALLDDPPPGPVRDFLLGPVGRRNEPPA